MQGGGDGGEGVAAAGINVRDIHDALEVVCEGDCHGGVRARAEAGDGDDAGGRGGGADGGEGGNCGGRGGAGSGKCGGARGGGGGVGRLREGGAGSGAGRAAAPTACRVGTGGGGAKTEPLYVRCGARREGGLGVGDELLELGRGGEATAQSCDAGAEGVGGVDVLEVLVGLYGEGRGAGDGEGCGQPGGPGMGFSGGDEGLDGLQGRQGGRGGGRCPVPLCHQGEELIDVEPEGGLVEARVPGHFGCED